MNKNTFVAEALLNALTGSQATTVVTDSDTARVLAQEVIDRNKEAHQLRLELHHRPSHGELWDAYDEIERKEAVIQNIQMARRDEKSRARAENDRAFGELARLERENSELRQALTEANAKLTEATTRYVVECFDDHRANWAVSLFSKRGGYATKVEAELDAAKLRKSNQLQYRVVPQSK